jgi:hypothetical protein
MNPFSKGGVVDLGRAGGRWHNCLTNSNLPSINFLAHTVTRDHQEVFELYQNSNFEVKCFRAGFPTAFAQSVVPQLKPRLTRSADFTTRIACGC